MPKFGRCLNVSASISSPIRRVAELSLAQRQLVEIVKALSLDARLVIMDEPTSSLTLTETDRLMRVIARPQGRRCQRHLHFASAQRGEANAPTASVVLRDGRMVGALDRAPN